MQVGAGTMNPATFLRVLGPEPWRVCYVEPSVRPDDSRYGDNPNRLQQHTQFQARPLQVPTWWQDTQAVGLVVACGIRQRSVAWLFAVSCCDLSEQSSVTTSDFYAMSNWHCLFPALWVHHLSKV